MLAGCMSLRSVLRYLLIAVWLAIGGNKQAREHRVWLTSCAGRMYKLALRLSTVQ